MAFSDELDLLSSDTQEILAHQSITIKRVRPVGDPDPVTFERTETTDGDTLNAVPIEPYIARDEYGRRIVRQAWIVRVADTTFIPSPAGHVVAGGQTYPIATVNTIQGGREYEITSERLIG